MAVDVEGTVGKVRIRGGRAGSRGGRVGIAGGYVVEGLLGLS